MSNLEKYKNFKIKQFEKNQIFIDNIIEHIILVDIDLFTEIVHPTLEKTIDFDGSVFEFIGLILNNDTFTFYYLNGKYTDITMISLSGGNLLDKYEVYKQTQLVN